MKLKNKKTGKIGYLYEHSLVQDIIIVYDVKGIVGKYKSITELCEEWEDAPEEPKEYWYIADNGEIEKDTDDGGAYEERMKEIGNHFETEEEAEKAVEKLKAFANLRKRGLKFNGWDEADRGMVGEFAIYCDALELDGIERELEIVFGREEL